MHKSEAKRLLEQDRPLRLAFNNWYINSNKAKDFTSLMIFGEGFSDALKERKIDILKEKISVNVIISAYQKYCEPYGKDWKPGIEECFATGWEVGKKYYPKKEEDKKESIKEERNRLLKVTIRTAADVWTLKAEQDLRGDMIPNLRGEIIFKGNREEFGKFLMKLHAKDTETLPASQRGLKYQEIIQGIVDNTNNEVWIWSKWWNQYRSNKILTIEDI